MSNWTEEIIVVIPIAERDNMALLASKVMPDVSEGKMFDAIRLSANGLEPATHLMTICPLVDNLAGAWCNSFNVPSDYTTTINLSPSDKRLAQTSIKDSYFTIAIVSRIENGSIVKSDKTIKLAYGLQSLIVDNYHDVLNEIGLQRIIDNGEP